MHRVDSIVRIPESLVPVIRRRDNDLVRHTIACRVMRLEIDVATFVPSGDYEGDVVFPRARNRIHQTLREASSAPAVRENADVGRRGFRECLLRLNGEIDGLDRVRGGSRSRSRQEFCAHDAGGPIHPRNAKSIVAHRANDASAVRTVAVVIEGIAAIGDCIEPVGTRGTDNLQVTERHGEIGRRGPDVFGEIRMLVVDPGVHDGNDVSSRAGADIPCSNRANVCASEARRAENALTSVLERVLFVEEGIVWNGVRIEQGIRLGVLDVASGGQVLDQSDHVLVTRTHQNQRARDPLKPLDIICADRTGRILPRLAAKLDQHFVGDRLVSPNRLNFQLRDCRASPCKQRQQQGCRTTTVRMHEDLLALTLRMGSSLVRLAPSFFN